MSPVVSTLPISISHLFLYGEYTLEIFVHCFPVFLFLPSYLKSFHLCSHHIYLDFPVSYFQKFPLFFLLLLTSLVPFSSWNPEIPHRPYAY
ncbi:unnamed protein product [Meloidogyne enterolobii]|uniref:Uncharacterized protein n=1 Tax=Meloidogyne enterolobii TaxID=390850 RepID=A0ACB0Y5F1_MELEN